MPASGPDFISLQSRDLDGSQAFYEKYLGLVRSQAGPPHAVVFETKPITFALRAIVPGTDLASVAQPGIGAAIWLHATDVQDIHDALVADGHNRLRADRRAFRPDVHLRRPRRLPGHSPRPCLIGETVPSQQAPGGGVDQRRDEYQVQQPVMQRVGHSSSRRIVVRPCYRPEPAIARLKTALLRLAQQLLDEDPAA
jgi:hypothetical protein